MVYHQTLNENNNSTIESKIIIRRKSIKDPFAQREAENYENPIPSREFISAHLKDRTGPASLKELAQELSLKGDVKTEALRRRLKAMLRDGQLRLSRAGQYGLIDKLNLTQGIIRGHPDGFGFLIPDDGSPDIYLNSLQMTCAFDGDKALVRATDKDYRGKKEGKVVDVVTHNTKQLVGRFSIVSGMAFVKPENRRINQDVLINLDSSLKAKDGDIVLVDIMVQPKFRQQPIGKVIEVIGEHMAPGMEIDIALRSFGIPSEWSAAVQNAADSVPVEVRNADMTGRVDLTQQPFVTIDGEDARDFDDAVYARKNKSGGWTLSVAIADVSHYVTPETALDLEATSRGTSVYFPERVIPMLPKTLSNGICSLNPGVDRLALVCEMEIDATGSVASYQFYNAVIHSHARLTYTQVAAILQEPESEAGQRAITDFSQLVPDLKQLHQLFNVLMKARLRRGAIDFDSTETRIIFDANKKIEQIIPVVRNDAHRLIEECMLCANTCAADFITKLGIPGLFRVHEGPGLEKLEKLRKYLGELGLSLGGGLKPGTKDFQKLLVEIQKRDDQLTLQTVVLRSLSQAVYQPDNEGHFGLGYEAYAHYTSPIRRYPDLLIHRAIKSVIAGKRNTPLVRRTDTTELIEASRSYPYSLEKMIVLGEHCSMTERRADEATRDVVAWLKCEYMEEHIGDTFNGKVTAVVPFGLFVQLHDVFIEGLVHITSLKSDYYIYDEIKHRLIGEHTRTVYALGKELEIQVARVDLDERKIDFELVGAEKSNKVNKTPKPGKAAKKKSPTKRNRALGKKPDRIKKH